MDKELDPSSIRDLQGRNKVRRMFDALLMHFATRSAAEDGVLQSKVMAFEMIKFSDFFREKRKLDERYSVKDAIDEMNRSKAETVRKNAKVIEGMISWMEKHDLYFAENFEILEIQAATNARGISIADPEIQSFDELKEDGSGRPIGKTIRDSESDEFDEVLNILRILSVLIASELGALGATRVEKIWSQTRNQIVSGLPIYKFGIYKYANEKEVDSTYEQIVNNPEILRNQINNKDFIKHHVYKTPTLSNVEMEVLNTILEYMEFKRWDYAHFEVSEKSLKEEIKKGVEAAKLAYTFDHSHQDEPVEEGIRGDWITV
ncbi:hypothetical protein [Weissella soli]|nr:hypothetical protein [Weissella soli]NKY83676.1 hypothetical protein [Weissella soli]